MTTTEQPRFVLCSEESQMPNAIVPRNVLYTPDFVSIVLDRGGAAKPRYTYAILPPALISNERENIDFNTLAMSMGVWYEHDWRTSEKQSEKSLFVTSGDARKILEGIVTDQSRTLSAVLQGRIQDELRKITGFEVHYHILQIGLNSVFYNEWLQDKTFVDQLNIQLQIIGFQYNLESRILSKVPD